MLSLDSFWALTIQYVQEKGLVYDLPLRRKIFKLLYKLLVSLLDPNYVRQLAVKCPSCS